MSVNLPWRLIMTRLTAAENTESSATAVPASSARETPWPGQKRQAVPAMAINIPPILRVESVSERVQKRLSRAVASGIMQ